MWTYKNEEYDTAPDDYLGFVYLITEKSTGKKYVGKKLFWNKPVWRKVDGKRKRVKKESDWKKYHGSSKALQEQVEKHGPENYDREILHLCKAKGEMSFIELEEQMQRRVLFRTDYYNEFIGCKLHSKHVKSLAERYEDL